MTCSLGHLKDSAALQLFFEKAIWELVKIFYVDEVDISTSIAQVLPLTCDKRVCVKPYEAAVSFSICPSGPSVRAVPQGLPADRIPARGKHPCMILHPTGKISLSDRRHACQPLLTLASRASLLALQALSSWLRKFHILFADSSAPPLLSEVDRLKASETPDGDAAYWPLLQKVTALGWVQEAYDLLTSHSVFATSYADQLRKPNLKAQVTPPASDSASADV